jgi:hypothetical protein
VTVSSSSSSQPKNCTPGRTIRFTLSNLSTTDRQADV